MRWLVIAHHLPDRAICREVIIERFAHRADESPAFALAQSCAAMLRGRAYIQQYSIWFEDVVRLGQGMNHALTRHSSEHPREDNDIELICFLFYMFSVADTICNAIFEFFRQCFPGGTDGFFVGVEGDDLPCAESG